MKEKTKFSTRCNIISIVLLIIFIVKVIIDWVRYDTFLNSAPFWLWVAVDAVYFVVPAIIMFIIGLAIKYKHKK